MFSQAPKTPWTGKGGRSAATTLMAATTAAAPAMSVCIVGIESAGFSERPPESNVSAFPTRTTGGRFAAAPRGSQLTFTRRGGSAEPRATPRNIPIFSAWICFGPCTSQRSPASRASARAASASRVGVQSAGPRFTRSRAQQTASAIPTPSRMASATFAILLGAGRQRERQPLHLGRAAGLGRLVGSNR